jgi:membrane-bound lytic murein transglycosylase B
VSVRPASRTILIVVAVVAALGLVATAVLVFLAPRVPGMPEAGPVVEEPAPAWAPPAEPPVAAAEPGVGIAGLVDAEWLASTAAATDIPERSLAAYAGAALAKSATMPECGLSWNTIAGIGATESDHGRHGGSAVGADGTVTPPIYGVPLAGGEGVEHIPDSDGGALDGDAEFDRAVGPFQLIPQTWRNWHTDGNGDGVEDPHNIDDAAMATANYLCRVSIHIDTEAGWIAAVSGFNSPQAYRDSVARYAVRYAEEL